MFGLKNYKKIIKIINSNNLIITKNWNKKNYKNNVLLRHDVDFSIELALLIAEFEFKHKIQSTYFFMCSSNMYNLFSKENIKIVKTIKNLGHKISLHFDPTVHKSQKSFLIEKNIFEKIFNVKLDIISIHRPNKFLLNKESSLFGISHTYQKKYFDELNYISDSAGKEVYKPLKNFLKKRNRIGLQLLLHPIWWTIKSKSPTDSLNKWIKHNTKFITSEVAINCKTYNLS